MSDEERKIRIIGLETFAKENRSVGADRMRQSLSGFSRTDIAIELPSKVHLDIIRRLIPESAEINPNGWRIVEFAGESEIDSRTRAPIWILTKSNEISYWKSVLPDYAKRCDSRYYCEID